VCALCESQEPNDNWFHMSHIVWRLEILNFWRQSSRPSILDLEAVQGHFLAVFVKQSVNIIRGN
jgi:hypothetical protein